MPPKASVSSDKTAPATEGIPSGKDTATPSTPVVATPSAPAVAVPVVDINAKLKAIAAENAAAKTELETYFGAERWPKLMQWAAQKQLTPDNVLSICGNLRRSRRQWVLVEGNDKAALILTANHFIIELGRRPTDADEEALEKALKEAPAV